MTPRSSQRLRASLFLLLLLLVSASVHAQGCSQCRDNAAATPLATQHAYREAILLLMGAGLGVVAAAVAIGRRFR